MFFRFFFALFFAYKAISKFGTLLNFVLLQLGDEHSRRAENVLARRKQETYQAYLRRSLDLVQTWLGDPFSKGSLRMCVAFALIYPSIAFLIAYALDGDYRIFGAWILPSTVSENTRRYWLIGTASLLTTEFLIGFYSSRIDAQLQQADVGRNLGRSLIAATALVIGLSLCTLLFAQTTLGAIVMLSIYSIALFISAWRIFKSGAYAPAVATLTGLVGAELYVLAFSHAGHGPVAASLAGSTTFFICICVAAAAEAVRPSPESTHLVFLLATVLALVLALATICLASGYKLGGGITVPLLVIGILPLINGLFDWLSLAVSRYFMRKAAEEERVLRLFIDIAIDTILAVVASAFLTASIFLSVAFIDGLNGASLASSLGDDPWKSGLMVTFMILTTLCPTAIHIVCALAAWMTRTTPGSESWEARSKLLARFLAVAMPVFYLVAMFATADGLRRLLPYIASWTASF